MSHYFRTREETEAWLNQMEIKGYTINDDLTVNVDGDVNISHRSLSYIPIKFTRVKGSFYCQYNSMDSLQGCPGFVGGDFYCYNNQLTSLEGSPKHVGGSFLCLRNKLTSLRGTPNTIGNNFDCSQNYLSDLEYCPKIVGGGFNCSANQLATLEKSPNFVLREFFCHTNPNLGELQEMTNFPSIKFALKKLNIELNQKIGAPKLT